MHAAEGVGFLRDPKGRTCVIVSHTVLQCSDCSTMHVHTMCEGATKSTAAVHMDSIPQSAGATSMTDTRMHSHDRGEDTRATFGQELVPLRCVRHNGGFGE
jgi:hypothetical protein